MSAATAERYRKPSEGNVRTWAAQTRPDKPLDHDQPLPVDVIAAYNKAHPDFQFSMRRAQRIEWWAE